MSPSEIRNWPIEDLADTLAMNECEPLYDENVALATLGSWIINHAGFGSKRYVKHTELLPWKVNTDATGGDVLGFFKGLAKKKEAMTK